MAFRNTNHTHPKEFKIPRVQKHKTEFEENFPFLERRTPAKSMTVPEAQKLLKKVHTVANWLDNAVPFSPIPIGLDTIAVSIDFIFFDLLICQARLSNDRVNRFHVGIHTCPW